MPARKPRKARPNERYSGYDSKFEYDLHQELLANWEFHPKGIPYTVEKVYNPDFKKVIDGYTYYIEAKGRFWDADEYSKYKWARDSMSDREEIVFLFYNENAPMPRSKKRKDGTKMSHGEWAEKNGFQYFNRDTLPEEFK
jgi:hypothetical protein